MSFSLGAFNLSDFFKLFDCHTSAAETAPNPPLKKQRPMIFVPTALSLPTTVEKSAESQNTPFESILKNRSEQMLRKPVAQPIDGIPQENMADYQTSRIVISAMRNFLYVYSPNASDAGTLNPDRITYDTTMCAFSFINEFSRLIRIEPGPFTAYACEKRLFGEGGESATTEFCQINQGYKIAGKEILPELKIAKSAYNALQSSDFLRISKN